MPIRSALRYVSLRATRILAGSLALAVTSVAIAQPPAGARPGRSDSRTDRALESRARVLDRAPDALRPGLAESAGGFSSPGLAGGRTGAEVRNSARLGGDRSGVERLSLDRTDVGRGPATQEPDRPADARDQERGNSGFRFGWLFGGERQETKRPSSAADANRPAAALEADRQVAGNAMAEARGQARSENRPGQPVENQRLIASERTLGLADTQLARRLAQIDQMRDQALATGNENLLVQADQLEALARAQFTQRTTDERTVGTAMRTFNQQRQSASTPVDQTPVEPTPVGPIAPVESAPIVLEPTTPEVEVVTETSQR